MVTAVINGVFSARLSPHRECVRWVCVGVVVVREIACEWKLDFFDSSVCSRCVLLLFRSRSRYGAVRTDKCQQHND